MKEEILRRRVKNTLYSLYTDYLETNTQKRFNEVRENDPYINQVIDDVVDFVIQELPLEDFILEELKGGRHVKY
ncbi:MAG: hypothetical protein ACI4U3_03650 [Traorella sp.]